MITIKAATTSGHTPILTLIAAAFGDGEGPAIQKLVTGLLAETCRPPLYNFVAESSGQISGYICFSPLKLQPKTNASAYILAPLCVHPQQQRVGIGTALIKAGLDQLKANKIDYALVYGDPAYYGKFGFGADLANNFAPPYQLSFPHGWQAIALNPPSISPPSAQVGPISATPVLALMNKDLW